MLSPSCTPGLMPNPVAGPDRPSYFNRHLSLLEEAMEDSWIFQQSSALPISSRSLCPAKISETLKEKAYKSRRCALARVGNTSASHSLGGRPGTAPPPPTFHHHPSLQASLLATSDCRPSPLSPSLPALADWPEFVL